MLDRRYILRSKGHLDSLQLLQTILKKIITHQKVRIFQLSQLERSDIKVLLKKKIYRTNNIQKVMQPSMAEYKKKLKKVVELVDSIKIYPLVGIF